MESQAKTEIAPLFIEGLAPAERKPAARGHVCGGVCCACRPIRVMRDNCLKNNTEDSCGSFVDGFKQCVAAKKAEIEARKAAQMLL
jgi:hypothetical protein